jgi:hypothetical protein
MKHTHILISLALAAVAFNVSAASTDPFDFDYEIAGNVLERPALVFNDGTDTYLQPRVGQNLKVDGGHSQGPYIVVPGTPEEIHYSTGGAVATAYWKKTNHFMGERGGENGDLPIGFSGFSDRLDLIGELTHLDSTRAMSATLPLSQLVKALVPQGWTGSAQKEVDLTGSSSFATRAGENWMQSLDRLMGSTDLYADVDFDTRHVSLRRSAPKSAGVNYADGAGERASRILNGEVTARGPQATQVSTEGHGSLLFTKFGATGIRDGDDSHVEIRFTSKPLQELSVVSGEGKSLKPHWDDTTHVLTINRADRFVVSNGVDEVEVARVAGTIYDFDAANPASLQGVFDKDGVTFFKFADTVGSVTVSDVKHMGFGEQKGRYYKFNGTADQFIVNADGNVVNVTRKHDVRFFDRPATS